MSDLISRQAVIRMFNTADRYIAESLKLCDTDKTFPQNEVFIVDDMYEGLEQLPSAEKRTNKRTKTHACDLPSAEPEIIRCKDCKHYSDRKCNSSKMWQLLYGNLSEVEFIERDPEDFCSYARRKK